MFYIIGWVLFSAPNHRTAEGPTIELVQRMGAVACSVREGALGAADSATSFAQEEASYVFRCYKSMCGLRKCAVRCKQRCENVYCVRFICQVLLAIKTPLVVTCGPMANAGYACSDLCVACYTLGEPPKPPEEGNAKDQAKPVQQTVEKEPSVGKKRAISEGDCVKLIAINAAAVATFISFVAGMVFFYAGTATPFEQALRTVEGRFSDQPNPMQVQIDSLRNESQQIRSESQQTRAMLEMLWNLTNRTALRRQVIRSEARLVRQPDTI